MAVTGSLQAWRERRAPDPNQLDQHQFGKLENKAVFFCVAAEDCVKNEVRSNPRSLFLARKLTAPCSQSCVQAWTAVPIHSTPFVTLVNIKLSACVRCRGPLDSMACMCGAVVQERNQSSIFRVLGNQFWTVCVCVCACVTKLHVRMASTSWSAPVLVSPCGSSHACRHLTTGGMHDPAHLCPARRCMLTHAGWLCTLQA